MSKLCENCKYTCIPASKTPCLNCVTYENWQPQVPTSLNKFCGTCNHMLLGFSEEPCVTCLTSEKESSQWEPVKEVNKSCGTCEHERVFSTDTSYFCHRCAGLDKWEPEEDPKVEANEGMFCPFKNGDQLHCRQEKCGIWAVDGRTGTGMCALVMIAGKAANR